jgi:hypothetical protein
LGHFILVPLQMKLGIHAPDHPQLPN